MKNETKFSTALIASLGKVAACVLLFPYQITINRKEGKLGVRSLLLGMRVERKKRESGKKSTEVTFHVPGFSISEIKAAFQKRKSPKKKQKLVLRRDVSLKRKAAKD